MKHLVDIVKTKVEKRTFENDGQLELVERVEHVVNNRTVLLEKNTGELVMDYQDASIKRRAQTIGIATTIFAKLLVSRAQDVLQIKNDYRGESDLFKLDNPKWLEVKKELQEMGNEFVETFEEALDFVEFLKSIKPHYTWGELITGLAHYSVTLAWLYSKYVSGFFPADVTVMLKASSTNKLLVREVIALSDSILDFIKHNEGKEVYINPTISDEGLGLSAAADFIIDGTIVNITTSGALTEKTKVDVNSVASFIELNKITKQYNLNGKASLIYLRYKDGIITHEFLD